MIEPHHMTKIHVFRALSVVLLASVFYMFEYVLQASPAVMTNDLMQSFGLNALGVSTLAAFFFYGYAPMQLPGGLLYDRFGPRLVMTLAVVVCACGALLFSLATHASLAALGRFMMGFGGAFSFVGVLLVASRWFPAKYFALIAGLVQLLASVGAIVGQVALSRVVNHIGWRHTLFAVFIAGLILAILIPLVVRNYPKFIQAPKKKKIGHGEIHSLRIIFSRAQTWVVAFYSFFIWVPITVFAALWGVDYIRQLYHLSTAVAAEMMAVMWVGVAVGSPFFGWWSDHLGRRSFPLYLSAIIGFIAAVCALYVKLPLPAMIIVLFLFGVGTSGQTLSFAVIKDNNAADTIGTAMGFNNFAVVVSGAICQPLAGYLLHLGWQGKIINGIHIYSLHDFQRALIILPLSFFLAALLARFLIKETRCLSQV